jgi:hypothetical protein
MVATNICDNFFILYKNPGGGGGAYIAWFTPPNLLALMMMRLLPRHVSERREEIGPRATAGAAVSESDLDARLMSGLKNRFIIIYCQLINKYIVYLTMPVLRRMIRQEVNLSLY